jgi:hypothetical protein
MMTGVILEGSVGNVGICCSVEDIRPEQTDQYPAYMARGVEVGSHQISC